MIRQRPARRFEDVGFGCRCGCDGWLRLGRVLFLQLLQRQFELGNLGIQPFRRAAELHAPQFGKLRLQPDNLRLPFAQFCLLAGNRRRLRRDQRTRLFRQSGDVQCHNRRIIGRTASAPMTLA